MKKILKLIWVNSLILLTFLILLNGIAFIIVSQGWFEESLSDTYPFTGKNRSLLMENGKSEEYNLKVMKEFYKLETEYQAYTVWSRLPFKGETTEINEEGDRVHICEDCLITDSSEVVRFFGGSTIWGTGVDNQGTIPSQYNSINPTQVVHNHGESGYVSRQGISRLVNLLNQGEQTDKVVFYDGFNDIMTLCRAEVGMNSHDRALQINDFIKTAKATRSAKYKITSFLRLIFIDYTVLAIQQLKRNEVDDNLRYKCCTDDTNLQNVANTLVNNWRLANSICEGNGIEFHAFLQPSIFMGEPILKEGHRKRIEDDCIAEVYPRICEMVAEQLNGEIWFTDLAMVFDGKGPFFIDACHVTDQANNLVAHKINGALLRKDSIGQSVGK